MKGKEQTKKISETKYQVVQVGWDRENQLSLVLVDAGIRELRKIKPKDIVYVKHKDKKKTAMVSVQFREHLGIGDVCTVSTKLAKQLGLKAGDKVEIITNVRKSDIVRMRNKQPSSFIDFLATIR